MQEQYYIRTAGDIIDYLTAQGLDPDDIERVIKFLPKQLKAFKDQEHDPSDTSRIPVSLPSNLN